MYYGSLIFSDMVIFGTCIPCGVLVMVSLNIGSFEKDFFQKMDAFEVIQLVLAVFFWCMGYIGQAYSVSYLTNDKVEGMVTMLRILIVSHVGSLPLGALFVFLYLVTKFWLFGLLTALYCACLPSVGFMFYLFLLILGDFLNNQTFEDYFSSINLINNFMAEGDFNATSSVFYYIVFGIGISGPLNFAVAYIFDYKQNFTTSWRIKNEIKNESEEEMMVEESIDSSQDN